MHYLDDFFGVKWEKSQCNSQIQVIIAVCEKIGLPIAPDKTYWATTFIQFLGLNINSVQQMIFVPACKHDAILSKIKHMLLSKTMKLKTIQSLAWSFNFYAKVKPGGHTFIRHLYDVQKSQLLHYHINITGELRKDLRMWYAFLWNDNMGTPFLNIREHDNFESSFSTDTTCSDSRG